MNNTFIARSYTNQEFCKVEYLDKKYVVVRPTLNSYDIMILKTYAFITGMRAVLSEPERKALLVDDLMDVGYIVQKGEKGLFLYSNKNKIKMYIDFDSVLKELILRTNVNKTLDTLSEYLSEGIVRVEEQGSQLVFLYEKKTQSLST